MAGRDDGDSDRLVSACGAEGLDFPAVAAAADEVAGVGFGTARLDAAEQPARAVAPTSAAAASRRLRRRTVIRDLPGSGPGARRNTTLV
ncbi:MAG: hypothetical protein ACR2F6_04145 [Mycobacteriales bacterium]